jgi:tetratricopeptide (TPR) repeat protein
MKSKLYSFILSLTILSLASCKTASKMYEKGNYDEAVELAAKKLQKDPSDQKLINIIQSSYRYAVNDHQSKIRAHSESTGELKWEWIYNDYAALQKMYEAIRKVPSVYNLIDPINYSSYLVTYGEKAGEIRYERGMAFMQRQDKQAYRNAYREFKMALGFKPGNREIADRMNEAYEFAVTNVVVLPMQQYGGYVYSSYAIVGTNLDDQLLNNLKFGNSNEFLKFYSSWDARSMNIRADMVVDMQMATVNLGRSHDYRTTRKVSKEVVIKERVIRPDSIVKEYAWVHADITTTRRTMNSEAVLRVNVTDANGQWLWSENYNANHAWNTEFSTYTGDSRALSESDKALTARRPEREPDDNDVMRCLLEDISRNAQNGLRYYFSRY